MGAIAMMPDGAMSSHHNHTINKSCQEQPQTKKIKNKQEQKWNQ